MFKSIWLENLSLFNKCVKNSGGKMKTLYSEYDSDGDMIVLVEYTKISPENKKEYESKRKRFNLNKV